MTDNERALCDALQAAIEQMARLEERVHALEARLVKLENPSAAAWAADVSVPRSGEMTPIPPAPSAAEWLKWYTMPPASRQWAATSDGWKPL